MIIKRSLIILFWVGLIFAALYFPYWIIFPVEERTLNVFAWGDILAPDVIAAFEKESGIKIRLNYYSTNEELLVKLRATGGEGYDLIIPSDYAVSILAKEDLLKPLDHSKLHFWQDLNPRLTHLSFDPENRYSVPYEWELFGIGIDRNFFKHHHFEPSLKLIFDVTDYKIAMINDPMQALLFADLYLHGKVSKVDEQELAEIKNLLMTQKKWVEVYADFRADYFLATGNCPVAVATSSYIIRAKRTFPFIDFILPKEGTFITIENFCIPSASNREELAYAFMNYLYRPSSIKHHFEMFGLFSSTLKEENIFEFSPDIQNLVHVLEQSPPIYHYFQRIVPQQQLWDLWVDVKS